VSQKGIVTCGVASSASGTFPLLPNSTKQDKGAEHWGYHQCRLLLASERWAIVPVAVGAHLHGRAFYSSGETVSPPFTAFLPTYCHG